MIWVKRLAPFVIIGVIWLAYNLYTKNQVEQRALLDKEYALVTARVWVASAKYRNNPEGFIKFRDSLLGEHSLTNSQVRKFINEYKNEPEKLSPFTAMINTFIDSLIAIEDSLLKHNNEDLDERHKSPEVVP